MDPFELASGDLRDQLVAATVAGLKTATSSLLASYEIRDEPLPGTGLHALLDRDDRPIGVVDVESIEVRRLGDVGDDVARAEGEGYTDAADWRRAHETFWHDSGAVAAIQRHRVGWELDDDALVMIETYRWRPELLGTDRLLLRPFRDDDADAFAVINADPAVMKHFTTGPLDRKAADSLLRRCIDRFHEHGYGLSAVERLSDGALLGFTGLNHHRWYPDEVEIGWRLARHAWGQGYATEAATAWVRRAFGLLGLPQLISVAVPANIPSIAVMHRLGFTYREAATYEGLDVVVHALDRPASSSDG
ncbi:MAG TPA: GNAT family N-acetyltransferase [Jiangellaceae bacterium]